MASVTNSSLLNQTTTDSPPSSKSQPDTGLIVGLTITGAVVVIIALGAFYYWYHRHKSSLKSSVPAATPRTPAIAVPPPLPPHTPGIHKAPAHHALPLIDCLNSICKQYSINHLQLDRRYFNFEHNKCYCDQCYPKTKTNQFNVAGSTYTVPRGWVRYGLQIDSTFAQSNQIFKQWYTTYYGTSKDKLGLIMRNRFIPFPGDQLLSGETFLTHLPDKQHVYTSPSIHYASLGHICPKDTTKINDKWYDFQVVLECKQNPEGIIKQHGCRRNVCPIISDSEIEWKTKQRSSVVPYGLLICARKHKCTKQCRH